LSVLAACHVLFYTKHTWKDNTAENIPDENLFNCIQEDCQKGTYIHRNYRQSGVFDDARVESNILDSGDAEENSEDECVENIQNEINQDELSDPRMSYRVIEFTENSAELENNLNNSMKMKLDLNRNGYKKSINNQGTKLKMEHGSDFQLDSGMLTPISDVSSVQETRSAGKTDKLSVMDPSLFSIMSAVSSTRQQSESADDLHSENSMEKSKQVLLAVQR